MFKYYTDIDIRKEKQNNGSQRQNSAHLKTVQ